CKFTLLEPYKQLYYNILIYRTPLNIEDKQIYWGKVLTTRSNGTIYLFVDSNSSFQIMTETASPNHKKN
ncbi:hypothetical protein, partial [Phocaeicola vulgatus]|uniref:hypothetical protein n=1 Tax=Phocaeicola vulgatus TaxID=821 RepID=UPI0035661B2F